MRASYSFSARALSNVFTASFKSVVPRVIRESLSLDGGVTWRSNFLAWIIKSERLQNDKSKRKNALAIRNFGKFPSDIKAASEFASDLVEKCAK